jgi:hypothetical protein
MPLPSISPSQMDSLVMTDTGVKRLTKQRDSVLTGLEQI